MVPVSCYAKIFFNEYLLNPDTSKYHIVFDQTLSGALVTHDLEVALQKFLESVYIFQCNLHENDQGELFWKAHRQSIQLKIEKEFSKENIQEFIYRPFHLTKDALCRFGLFKLNENSYRFICVVHHVLIDGQKFNDFIQIISDIYNKQPFSLPSIAEQKTTLREQASLNAAKLERFQDTSLS